jgi:protein associated with RNAse G/E
MQIGEPIHVRAYKSDSTCYRWWSATVESVTPDQIVVVTPAGHRVEDPSGGWISKHSIRSYYWPGKPYSLLEVYRPDGRLDEIYVNINSPVEIDDDQIRFTDYELDVSRRPPDKARLVDQDEFREAAARYGYSEEFQETCYELARQAQELANRWPAGEMPRW